MSELICSLAQQRNLTFIRAYRAVQQFYPITVTQFAVYWNWAKSL